jgi:two-component sensor histidine kinase/ActR/RegA family two-component response regulator
MTPTRVLIVDDEPDDRALVAREVRDLFADAEVREAGTREQLEGALTEAPGLVVTDLALRWGTGHEVLMRVRERWPGAPVVMFTDSGDETTAVELMKAGLDDYVVKSARQLPRLRASLRLAVEGARSRAALSERERQLTAALAHRDTVVRELHHRVRNNLQTLLSLLEWRSRLHGGAVAEELRELAGRMRALAAVQAEIYRTDRLDRVDFAATLQRVAQELVGERGGGRVRVEEHVSGPVLLDVARAMPLALLSHEAMLNALKHAWPDGRTGTLRLELAQDGAGTRLAIGDDGVGAGETAGPGGFGARLMRGLAAEAQARLATESRPGEGTTVTLRLD